ncbi:hypothetical protein FA13DRAFT_1880931 [Coprinellus micaceus]|uniref:Uncharacterized protein n=1 Tax=Coprinellus micaceus TaxID=71717 RepID=A0A4Y7TTT3_COPMI|nr:hypothetical protein FA13DRAFT_1880931 [Coprinellus micaceus]
MTKQDRFTKAARPFIGFPHPFLPSHHVLIARLAFDTASRKRICLIRRAFDFFIPSPPSSVLDFPLRCGLSRLIRRLERQGRRPLLRGRHPFSMKLCRLVSSLQGWLGHGHGRHAVPTLAFLYFDPASAWQTGALARKSRRDIAPTVSGGGFPQLANPGEEPGAGLKSCRHAMVVCIQINVAALGGEHFQYRSTVP